MEIQLVSLVANLSGQPRRETLNGRNYLVCSVSMIVPGVLEGSQGPLLYQEDEVSRNVDAWNGMPLTHRHPTIAGKPVSARRPDVTNKFKLGEIYNATYDGRLMAEAWFDIQATSRIDNRLITHLEAGKRIEVSTGLFTHNVEAPQGSVYNGKPYSHIAKINRPDHLAVLPDEVGACSLKDGCGLNVNQLPLEVNSMKDQLITWLTTNCQCWKGPNASSALNAMTEPELQQLKTTAENGLNTDKQLKTITNALSNGFVVNGAKVTLGADGTFKAEQVTPVVNANQTPQIIEIKPVGQPTDNRSETFLQLLERTGSQQEKDVWNTAVGMFNNEKATIVARLTDNITDPTAKANAVSVYNVMQLPDLRKIAPPAPVNVNGGGNVNTPNFALGAGGPLPNLNQVGSTSLEINRVNVKPVQKLTFENPLKKTS